MHAHSVWCNTSAPTAQAEKESHILMLARGRHVPTVGPLSRRLGSARHGTPSLLHIASLQQRARRPPPLAEGGGVAALTRRATLGPAVTSQCVEWRCETEVGEPVVHASATHVRERVKKKKKKHRHTTGKRHLSGRFSLVGAPDGHTGQNM